VTEDRLVWVVLVFNVQRSAAVDIVGSNPTCVFYFYFYFYFSQLLSHETIPEARESEGCARTLSEDENA
jgi:hypothetical protein